ncbi:MAG TPA: FHA domain-containing protein, partial [Steroidobacteraceae bacterium]|nr:FHA domain-containing protein [Steroidobacteraceae bacterium]
KAELLSTLNNFLIEQHAAGRKVLLIVDEAQNLEARVLEEIRLLSGVETTKEKVLRIILAGQPELNETLNAPRLEQLAQRVRLRFHLTALSESETRAYIEHRLEVAGASDREIFVPDTFHEIFRYTGGVPRLINTLCDTAMMAAFTENRDMVRLADVASAVAELRWPLYPERVQAAAARAQAAAAARAQAAAAAAPENETESDEEVPEAPAVGTPSPESAARETRARPTGGHGAAAHEAAAREAAAQEAVADDAVAKAVAQTVARETAAREGAAKTMAAATEPVGKLLVATDGRTVQEVPLRIGRLIIGRTPDNDIHIDSRFVSRHHCQVITTAHSCVIEDLNSTNGIYVKSARVRRHYLNDGDVVLIGKHELIYVDERAARGRPTASETEPKLQAVSEVPELRGTPAAEGSGDGKSKRQVGG